MLASMTLLEYVLNSCN